MLFPLKTAQKDSKDGTQTISEPQWCFGAERSALPHQLRSRGSASEQMEALTLTTMTHTATHTP